ncbi:MAG: NADH-ubiquinone/plastoquinone oxidoreductase chain 6 [Frankiales bacterium]|jgi:NADH-quinone oxidoreductase subunit J|nr:NADH-ubiquinone/plastoquinone oxidoreductase chain 6 [Frankiales bacterium]
MSGTLLAASSTGETIGFWVLAPIAVLAALAMVIAKNAVHCALFLAAVMMSLAGLYALQDAPFLAAVQVIVYTGAILMLFLFVLMLVGVDSSDSLVETLRGQRVAALLVGLGFVGLLTGAIGGAVTDDVKGLAQANADGNVVGIARLLFTKYVFAFEMTSALLITAALGAMVLAHKERLVPRLSQKELSRQRFASDHPFPLPGPGVFAEGDSIARGALLPDGSVAPSSLAPTLQALPTEEGPADGTVRS